MDFCLPEDVETAEDLEDAVLQITPTTSERCRLGDVEVSWFDANGTIDSLRSDENGVATFEVALSSLGLIPESDRHQPVIGISAQASGFASDTRYVRVIDCDAAGDAVARVEAFRRAQRDLAKFEALGSSAPFQDLAGPLHGELPPGLGAEEFERLVLAAGDDRLRQLWGLDQVAGGTLAERGVADPVASERFAELRDETEPRPGSLRLSLGRATPTDELTEIGSVFREILGNRGQRA